MTPLINYKTSSTYPQLVVHKYHKKVFYKNLWDEDPMLLESRGKVTLNDKVVINPFTKVFNYLENGTIIQNNEQVLAVEKVNGFMACLTWVPELQDVIVSTTGSLDSDYVEYAREMLPYAIDYLLKERPHETFIFEIVHPDDPHIIPENIGAYLLGKRSPLQTTPYTTSFPNQQVLDIYAKAMRVARPKYGEMLFNEVKDAAKRCKHEGFLVYGKTTTLKLKSPYYLALKAIARKKDILSLNKQRVDEEYYPLLDHLLELGSSFSSLSEQDRLIYIRNYYETNT